MTAARQASLSITNSQSLLKLMSIESVMPFNYLILCRPLLLLPSVFLSIGVFSNKSVLRIRWQKIRTQTCHRRMYRNNKPMKIYIISFVKPKCQRIDAFELSCWRRLLRVPWTVRRSNQSILKEIDPEYSLEGLMVKLTLQYFGHLMRRADSL